MLRSSGRCVLLIALLAPFAAGQDYRVEVTKKAPKAEGLAPEIATLISDEGLQVLRGESRALCEIWPCKQWQTISGFQQTPGRIYPFQPGQLMGLLHFPRRGKEFRDQTIPSGWYTLRYALQPVDGNHVGTSPTRDFLLLVRVADDKLPDTFDTDELLAASAAAAESAHPAMLCLQRPQPDAANEPAMRHIEEKDWWVLHFTGKGTSDGQSQQLSLDLIVAGHADE